jgi:hypothetical protein
MSVEIPDDRMIRSIQTNNLIGLRREIVLMLSSRDECASSTQFETVLLRPAEGPRARCRLSSIAGSG